jgi:hypothetical protein
MLRTRFQTLKAFALSNHKIGLKSPQFEPVWSHLNALHAVMAFLFEEGRFGISRDFHSVDNF